MTTAARRNSGHYAGISRISQVQLSESVRKSSLNRPFVCPILRLCWDSGGCFPGADQTRCQNRDRGAVDADGIPSGPTDSEDKPCCYCRALPAPGRSGVRLTRKHPCTNATIVVYCLRVVAVLFRVENALAVLRSAVRSRLAPPNRSSSPHPYVPSFHYRLPEMGTAYR